MYIYIYISISLSSEPQSPAGDWPQAARAGDV